MDYSKNLIKSGSTIKKALQKLNEVPETLTLFVVDEDNKMVGTLTDGDVRRGFLNEYEITDIVDKFMSSSFYALRNKDSSLQTINLIKLKKIKLLPVLGEDGKILKVYDLQKIHSILPIDAVLMAGGRGERLRPLTDKIPKPLLKIGNKPIIEHNIDNLISYGIENIFITIKYLGEQIVEHFRDGRDKGIKIQYIEETQPLGTIGSVSLIRNFMHDTILVMNSDLFTNINIEEFYQHFIDEDADMAVATIPYNVDIPYAVIDVNKNNIVSFTEKPTYTYYSNAGIYIIKRELLDLIPVNKYFNATDFMQALINNGYKVIKFPILGYWIDIGKPEDYKKTQEFYKYIKY